MACCCFRERFRRCPRIVVGRSCVSDYRTKPLPRPPLRSGWWINSIDRDGQRHWADVPDDVYGAFGHGEKRALIVLPSLDLVVSWNEARVESRDAQMRALKLLLAAASKR
ncbi:MAG: hypothetical protein HYS12_11035 [Planctomycetes bacterium]|nr:hypothetical protein [Planctomycetota bacterium]